MCVGFLCLCKCLNTLFHQRPVLLFLLLEKIGECLLDARELLGVVESYRGQRGTGVDYIGQHFVKILLTVGFRFNRLLYFLGRQRGHFPER